MNDQQTRGERVDALADALGVKPYGMVADSRIRLALEGWKDGHFDVLDLLEAIEARTRPEALPTHLVVGPDDALIIRLGETGWTDEQQDAFQSAILDGLAEIGLDGRAVVISADVEIAVARDCLSPMVVDALAEPS